MDKSIKILVTFIITQECGLLVYGYITLVCQRQLGAKLFYDHLLDADISSNTLSWRWVAGLQTEGKNT